MTPLQPLLQALSPLTEHTFLVRWLADAQKQRRFPRSVADDIESLLLLGRRKGPAAGLHKRLSDLFESCTAPVSQKSDLFRLVSVIETLKAQGWLNATVDDHEWNVPALIKEYADDLALLVKKPDRYAALLTMADWSRPLSLLSEAHWIAP